jgi:hypothetical protein
LLSIRKDLSSISSMDKKKKKNLKSITGTWNLRLGVKVTGSGSCG